MPMPRARRLVRTLVPLLLAGCVLVPEKGPEQVPPAPLSDRQVAALVDAAQAEWLRWGSKRALGAAGNTTCLVVSDGSCQDVMDGCGQEQAKALCPVVDEYWAATHSGISHDCSRNDVCEWRWPGPDRPVFTEAWSAAFVSAMMQRAGISEREFRPAIAHWRYIREALRGHASGYAVVPTPAVAAPGDLVCAGRPDDAGRPPYLTPGRIDEIRDVPMHCDIVVAIDLAARTLEAIGGNVQQTVAKTTVALNDRGRVPFEGETGRKWVLVMRARREAR